MRARGFTLVEVMVALAIVAIALPALLVALYQQVDDTGYLRDKSLAQMVAANQLAQMRLVVAATRSLTAGKDNGTVTLADRDWYWWIETTATEQANFFRIEIDVALQEEQREHPLYTLTTFMSGDLQEDTAGIGGGDGDGQLDAGGSDTGDGADTGAATGDGAGQGGGAGQPAGVSDGGS